MGRFIARKSESVQGVNQVWAGKEFNEAVDLILQVPVCEAFVYGDPLKQRAQSHGAQKKRVSVEAGDNLLVEPLQLGVEILEEFALN
jgi:hypothetical protein